MSKRLLNLLLALWLILGFALPAVAAYQVDLTANVPLYGQEKCIWCGAACGQMIMDGYPDPADRIFYAQVDVWNAIQARNSTDPTDVATGWATDPLGLCETLKSLNPPPGGTWHVHADATRDAVMFDILYWMNRNNYPVATLINHGQHWVVIVGYQSDIVPVSGSSPTLEKITINDPEPHNVGTQSTMLGSTWYGTYWNGAVGYAGTWDNQYVAVIEPPVEKGKVRVKAVKRIGEKIISAEEAVKFAEKWIDELGLIEKPAYSFLRKEGVINVQPLLVREGIKSEMEQEEMVPHYYIVPYGLEHEIEKCGVGLTRVCVIVNAYTGAFEEIGTFGKPIRYLPEKEAITAVARALKLKREEIMKVRANLMFQPSDITHIRIYPFWKVMVRDRALYVDQLGKVYGTIKPCVPGD